LLDALDAAVALLRRYGKTMWADWLEQDRARIQNGDRYGVEHVLQAFGGMGSLNDVVIGPANRDPIADDQIASVNMRLYELRDRMCDGATAVRRETGLR